MTAKQLCGTVGLLAAYGVLSHHPPQQKRDEELNTNEEAIEAVTVRIDPFLAGMLESVRVDRRLKSLDEAVDQMLMLAIAATRSMAPIRVAR